MAGRGHRRRGRTLGSTVAGVTVVGLLLGSAPAGAAAGTGTSGAGAAALAEPQTSSEGVEVRTYGVMQVRPYQESERPLVTVAVHGVQRVDGGTVVYWSAGTPLGAPALDRAVGLNELAGTQMRARFTNGGTVGSVRLVDRVGGQVYASLPDPDGRQFIPLTFASPLSAFPLEPGVMGTLFAVLPELPATTETVDVSLMFGVTIPDVPVSDGLLEPTADRKGVIPLGTGWPDVTEDAVRRAKEPELSVHPLSSVVEALDNSQVVTEQGAAVTIDLAADVLFAFDSADLTPQAGARLEEVAAQITAEAAPGALGIVGHTDSQGTDAYNLDLSRRRADSVAAVLGPAVVGVDLDVSVDGRGEAEPVGDNGTPEGQQANRRVTITYTREGGEG